MLQYPNIDPIAISLGPLQIHWYGIMYLIGFVAAWLLAKKRVSINGSGWNDEQVGDLIFYSAMGVVIGGRIGYMLFYNFSSLIDNPLSLFKVWQGGMSFHGGFLGVVLAVYLFSRKTKKPVFKVLDFVAPLVPIGLATGRLGNFIGAELYGRATDMPWGMVFPTDPFALVRHPSQLYQAGLEGLTLFLIIWFYSAKPRPTFAVSGMFCLGYGLFRSFVEFFREPDGGIFVAFDWLTRGQLLSLPMIIIGALVVVLAYRNNTFGKANDKSNVKVNK
ncbi:prolipoprotein diacylglyceryl transferase [Haliea sp. AH-315-K21]|uniref:Phosphatidylglycerol--prolipoprotein diacylglyceryl transferase n=1 Tax=SAR86 cluster bacterium TaxID=2030880 RepID=A0A2A5CIE5_9GAMM|nr:prolipoprotein diacylglyceryl transferase [Haliea sp. AH-315-K21]PCJ43657.1 MAG: prolipoprotein diacylglyceryl transferase [SAR86 cluster bacterium]